jgi:hypothetical protein
MKTITKIIFAIMMFIGGFAVAENTTYKYICLATKIHQGKTFYKLSPDESQKIGKMVFTFNPTTKTIIDRGGQKAKKLTYISSTTADNGKVVSTYRIDQDYLLIINDEIDEYTKTGMVPTNKKNEWYEFVCKVSKAN